MPPKGSPLRERKRPAQLQQAQVEVEESAEEAPPKYKRSIFRQRLRIVLFAAFLTSLSVLVAQRLGYLGSKPPLQPFSYERSLADYVPELPSPDEAVTSADDEKREAIVTAFREAWHAYEVDAFGSDEYHPLSHTGSNLSADGGVGYMIVDAIDTMVLMGLDEEYKRARDWCEKELVFDKGGQINVFEITIRVLGGLLSAYALTSDHVFLSLSTSLADSLIPVFSTPSGIPLTFIDLKTKTGIRDKDNNGMSGTAEAATLQLEFKYLAELTGEEDYWRYVERAMISIKRALRANLVPIFINSDSGEFYISPVRLGSRGDSYYEYLLKQYLQTARTEHVYRQMYDQAMEDVDKYLVKKSRLHSLTYTTEMYPRVGQNKIDWHLEPKQDHLACFIAGSLLLGVTEGQPPVPPDASKFSTEDKRDWRNGVEILETCMETHKTATGLAPEIAMFRKPEDPRSVVEDWYVKRDSDGSAILDGRYILRPETIESLFLAHRITGDPKYRAWGWQIFESIQKHCKTPNGAYAAVKDVETLPVVQEDKMETFMMSETLKYLFLLFSDSSVLPLDQWVFNTEAHPLPVFEPSIKSWIT